MSEICAAWLHDGSVEEKWSVVKSALTNTAESALGFEVRRQPDWFNESEAIIQPALQCRNELYRQWLCTKGTADLQRFRNARTEAHRVTGWPRTHGSSPKQRRLRRLDLGGKWYGIAFEPCSLDEGA